MQARENEFFKVGVARVAALQARRHLTLNLASRNQSHQNLDRVIAFDERSPHLDKIIL